VTARWFRAFHYGPDIHFTARTAETEADARARLLLYLIEHQLVNLAD
jgi:hypothetical protein